MALISFQKAAWTRGLRRQRTAKRTSTIRLEFRFDVEACTDTLVLYFYDICRFRDKSALYTRYSIQSFRKVAEDGPSIPPSFYRLRGLCNLHSGNLNKEQKLSPNDEQMSEPANKRCEITKHETVAYVREQSSSMESRDLLGMYKVCYIIWCIPRSSLFL